MSKAADLNAILDLCDEEKIQQWIELHPDIIPDGKFVCDRWVLSKVPIGTKKITDLAFLHETSGPWWFYMVELARPVVQIFNKADEFTSGFHHEVQQVRDWIGDFRNHAQSLSSDTSVKFGERFAQGLRLCSSIGMLFVGRRSELNNELRKKRWADFCESMYPHIEVRTYDHLVDVVARYEVINLFSLPQTQIGSL